MRAELIAQSRGDDTTETRVFEKLMCVVGPDTDSRYATYLGGNAIDVYRYDEREYFPAFTSPS
ncbi:amine oxidase [Streptomyces sp. NBRC 110611]|nr:amine oxidase [Streptomyces sp. NBRC 110611]